MGKTQERYSVDEAAQLLGVNRTTLLMMLSAIEPETETAKVKTLRPAQIEKIYAMMKSSR